jgi:hypothetical protein
MPRQGSIHINGVTYPLPEKFDSEHDANFQRIRQQMADLASGSGGTQVTLPVLIDGHRAELHTTPQGVFAAAAFLEAQRPATPRPRIVTGRAEGAVGKF